MASQPSAWAEVLGRVAYEFEMLRPLIPTYLHLLVSAIFPIYTAAHASLSRPPSAAPRKPGKATTKDVEPEEDGSPKIESLSPSDAIVFPLLAGGTLASLYFILKWLQDPTWLNWILGIYFSQLGLFFGMKFLKDGFSIVRSLFLPTQYSGAGYLWKVDNDGGGCFRTEAGQSTPSPLPGPWRRVSLPPAITRRIWTLRDLAYTKGKLEFRLQDLITVKMPIEILDVVSLGISCAVVSYHGFVSKPWYLTNFLGFAFCYGSLQYMTPTTAWTGTLVLCALFFYDIYFVFFTPMMVTVATKLDVPIKLLFPRPDGCVLPVGAPEGSPTMEEYLQCLAKKRTMAMLGLGDIVVPGMMLAFALRFDLYLYYLRQCPPRKDRKEVSQDQTAGKPIYVSAKGSWGERFWTTPKLRPNILRAKHFPKTYFHATVSGYLVGMITTVIVMQVVEHAQPALLYLVPGVLLALWGTALVNGDLKTLWNYSELPEDPVETERNSKQVEATGSEEDDTSHTTSKVATGSTEQNIESLEQSGSEKDTRAANESSKKPEEKPDRHVVYFSISLPATKVSVDGGRRNDKLPSQQITSTTAPPEDRQDHKFASRQQDEAGEYQARSATGAADGERPGKRVRRA